MVEGGKKGERKGEEGVKGLSCQGERTSGIIPFIPVALMILSSLSAVN